MFNVILRVIRFLNYLIFFFLICESAVCIGQKVDLSVNWLESRMNPKSGYDAHNYFSLKPSNPGLQFLVAYEFYATFFIHYRFYKY